MDIIDLLANDNYIIANKTIAKIYGLDEAVLLGELASEYKYWAKRDELKDGYFYSTIENVKDNTTLSDKKQRSALRQLKEAGIVEVKLMGLPAKRYIKIHSEQLLSILINSDCQNGNTSFAKTAKLEQPKEQPNNNNINNNKNNNKKESKKDSFNQIIVEYAKTLDVNIRAEITDLLFEWLKVRKAKRAAMTDRAIQMNIDKLNDLANKSGMSVVDYLKEIICRGWAAFYEIKDYSSYNKQPQRNEHIKSEDCF